MTDDDAALLRDLARVLSRLLLAPPDAAALDALRSPDVREALGPLLGDDARDALARLGARPHDEADARREFFEVLAVPGPRYKPPFESVHCDDRELDDGVVGGLLLGPSADDVALCYHRAGFELAAHELPDHLGCELAFVAALLARDDLPAAADFARAHPGRWVEPWAARLAADPASALYPSVARLAVALVGAVAAAAPRRRALPVVA